MAPTSFAPLHPIFHADPGSSAGDFNVARSAIFYTRQRHRSLSSSCKSLLSEKLNV